MRSAQRSLIAAVIVFLISPGLALPTAAAEPPAVTIGVLLDGRSERMELLGDLLRDEIMTLTSSDFDVSIPDEKVVVGNWTMGGVEEGLDRLLADPEVDAVLTLGAIASFAASLRSDFPKPVIAPLAIDAEIQGYPYEPSTDSSGVSNFTYANILSPTTRDVGAFLEIQPFTRLAVIIQPALSSAMPYLPESVESRVEALGIEVIRVAARATPAETVDAIPDDVDAVYLLPLMRFTIDEIEDLAVRLNRRTLPSFSMFGRAEVDRGILVGMRTDNFWRRLARRMALNLQRVLLGEDAGAIPVSFPENARLVINMKTAREIGVYPSWNAMAEAEQLFEDDTEDAPSLTLMEAVRWGEEHNLDLAAFDRRVAAGAEVVEQAKGAVRPQLAASLLASAIDSDRAEASLGAQAERTLGASLGIEQMVYVEPIVANLSIQKSLQANLEAEREAIRLDVVRDIATAFLLVRREMGLLEIQKENLRVTRSNLELARIRNRIGAAGASEVYRWQTEIAGAEQGVVTSRERRNVAKVGLNRVLNRPQNTRFQAEDVDLESPIFVTADPRFFSYIYSPRGYEVFIEFNVDEGLGRAPELEAFDEAIAAAQRALTAAKRRFFVPDISVVADVTEILAEDGAGSSGLDLPLPIEIPQADDTNWSVGLFAGLPLYTGGTNRAVKREAIEELRRLENLRWSASDRIEQRIRSALHIANASYYSILLSRAAAENSVKSLELVTEAYATGRVSIPELLDAQNTALAANEAANNAVYNFLIDLMELQRATNSFDFFITEDERDDYFRRLHDYMTRRGVEPRPGHVPGYPLGTGETPRRETP